MKNKTKKLLIVSNFPVHYRIDLYKSLLDTKNYNVKFIFLGEKKFQYKKILYENISKKIQLNSYDLLNTSSLKKHYSYLKILTRFNPNYIIITGLNSFLLHTLILKFVLKIKVIVWWGGTNESEKNINLLKFLYRKIITNYIDSAIFYSQLSMNNFKNYRKKVIQYKIIGNNTLKSHFKEKLPEDSFHKKNKQKFQILTVGFQTKRKNTITLVKAFESLKHQFSNVELIIIGDGSEVPLMKDYIRSKGIKDVKFLGQLKPNLVMEYYKKSDLYVQPSLVDQWPQTFNEASKFGVPILLSNKAGVFNKYVIKYKDIVMFEPTDVDELKNKILFIIRNPNVYLELKKASFYNTIEYNCDTATGEIINLINEL